MTRQTVIAIDGLVKEYATVAALQGISLRIDRGEIAALLGSNGAGKSTLFYILMGFRRPTAGSASVFGLDPFSLPESARAKIVFVPEEGALPPWASANDVARLYRHLYPQFDAAALQRMLDAWGLSPPARLATLSKGERRLTELAVALSCRPTLLLLDEPFAGLDLVMRIGVIDELRDLNRSMETTILYSSHILSDVEKIARRVIILRAGEITVDQSLEELDEPLEALFLRQYS